MIRFHLPAMLLIFCSLAALSQPQITVGTKYETWDGHDKYYFLHHGQMLAVKVRGTNKVRIQKLNPTTLKLEKVTLYEDFPAGSGVQQVVDFKGHIYVLYYLWNNKINLCAREIDFESGTFKGAGKIIFTVSEEISSELKFGKFDTFFPHDSSSMVVKYGLIPEVRKAKEQETILLYVFKPGLQEQWNTKVTMPYANRDMQNLDYSTDHNGNIYVTARVQEDKIGKAPSGDATKPPTARMEILKVAVGTGTVTSTKVQFGDNYINDVKLFETSQGELLGGGLYNKGGRSRGADGFVRFRFNPDGSLDNFVTHEIPLDIMNQYASAKEARRTLRDEAKKGAEVPAMSLNRIIAYPDGSIALIAEQTWWNRIHNQNGPGSTNIYYANEMLMCKIDGPGNLLWMKKLPKRQESAIAKGLSCHYAYDNGVHYLLYMDNKKNLNLPTTEEPEIYYDGKGGALTCYEVNDATGDVKKTFILNTEDVQGMELLQFNVTRIVKTAPYTFVFEAYARQGQDILVRMQLNK